MANRYWVGGTADWDTVVGIKWSDTSGGTGGFSVPTSVDDVYFNATSGAVTVTVIGAPNCNSLICTGFIGILTGSAVGISIYGSITLSAEMTLSGSIAINLQGTGSYTITSAGKVFTGSAIGILAGGTYTLQDALACTGTLFGLRILSGTLNTNNFDITCKRLQSTGTSAAALNLGSSNVYLTDTSSGSAVTLINFTNTSFSLNAGTSKIFVSGPASTSRPLQFSLGGRTLYDLEFLHCVGTATYTFLTSATINTLSSLHTNAYSMKLYNTITLNVGTWNCNGSSGNVLTLTNVYIGDATKPILNKTGGGSASISYADISYMDATPGGTWTATNSTDSANNTGITFTTTEAYSGSSLLFWSNF